MYENVYKNKTTQQLFAEENIKVYQRGASSNYESVLSPLLTNMKTNEMSAFTKDNEEVKIEEAIKNCTMIRLYFGDSRNNFSAQLKEAYEEANFFEGKRLEVLYVGNERSLGEFM